MAVPWPWLPPSRSLMRMPLLLLALGAPAVALRRLPLSQSFKLRDFSKQPPIEEGGAVHIAAASCRECSHLRGFVRSLAAQARLEGGAKPVLHLFLDLPCWSRVTELGVQEPGTLEAIDARAYNVDRIKGVPREATPHGKSCTMVRLFLPRLFLQLERLLYLDTDTVVVGSLRPVWDMSAPVIAMAENDIVFHGTSRHKPSAESFKRCPTWRNGTKAFVQSSVPGEPAKCWVGEHGLNAGVLKFNLTGWRAHNLDRHVDWWSGPFLRGELDMRMNDQDILNLILVGHNDYYAPLPCEANLLYTHRWMCLFTAEGTWASWDSKRSPLLERNERKPVVLHSKFGRGAARQQWTYLHSRTNHFARLVNLEGLRNGSSLCEVAGCERFVMEEDYTCTDCGHDYPRKPCDCKELRTDFVEDRSHKRKL